MSRRKQAVRIAHLHQHRAEIVGLLQRLAAGCLIHLATAQLNHARDHLIHIHEFFRTHDRDSAQIVAVQLRRRCDLFFISQQDRIQDPFLVQADHCLLDTVVRPFGEYDAYSFASDLFS